MKTWDFKEALDKLAARAGVQLPAFTKETPQQKEAFENLRRLLEDAVIFYRSHLLANTGDFPTICAPNAD